MKLDKVEYSEKHDSITVKTDQFEVRISSNMVGISVFDIRDYLSAYGVQINEGKESSVVFIPRSKISNGTSTNMGTGIVTLNIKKRK